MAKLAERGIALELVRHEDGDERIIARPALAISEALRAWLKENRKSLLEALRDADAIRSEQEVFDLGRERFGLREDGPPHPERDLGRAAHLGLIAKWSRSISPFRRKEIRTSAVSAGDPFRAAGRRKGCSACYGGFVSIAVEEDGQDYEEAVPCRQCSS